MSKVIILDVLAIVLAIVQYFIANNMFVQWIVWEGLGVVVLNMIIAQVQVNTITSLKKINAALNDRISKLLAGK
jgi:hypothetical protein